jgi:hypothetical protein
MADYVLHLQKAADRDLVLNPQAPASEATDSRIGVKYRHTCKTVTKFVLNSLIFGGVQSPKIYFFITIPLAVVLGPLISSVFLAVDNIRAIGMDIHELIEIGKLKSELNGSDLPEDLKKFTLQKVAQQKNILIKNITLELAVLAVRVAAVVATALVVAGLAVSPYAIPIISGIAIGAVCASLLIKGIVALIQRPQLSSSIFTRISLNWNKFCLWTQKAHFNYSKRSFIATIGKMTDEQREVQTIALQKKIAAYQTRKLKIKEIKRKLLVAGANDFEHTRALDPQGKIYDAEGTKEAHLKPVVEKIVASELTVEQEQAFLEYFRVNPKKFYDKNVAKKHLEKKILEFFASADTLKLVEDSKDLYAQWRKEPRPPGAFEKMKSKVLKLFQKATQTEVATPVQTAPVA